MGSSVRSLILVSFAGFWAATSFGQSGAYQPITGRGRVYWAFENTLGWPSLLGGVISSGLGTELDLPPEYGPHALGFVKRYGMRLTGIATSNTMEAGIGALLGEDPRYVRDGAGEPFGHRVRHVVAGTFLARSSDGDVLPAFARYIGISGSSFLSNTWRPNSEANTRGAMARIGLGFVGRMSKNAFDEFWPDVRQRVFGAH